MAHTNSIKKSLQDLQSSIKRAELQIDTLTEKVDMIMKLNSNRKGKKYVKELFDAIEELEQEALKLSKLEDDLKKSEDEHKEIIGKLYQKVDDNLKELMNLSPKDYF
ncbi:hypothetical protein O3M35_002001 [Rhynocoris fuscipes]|uniref:Uncharacterized protein n=1 Tax=Rhynocoris fuscipes TaxID=488301 RepID=A0AAW1CVD3_9HEMI